MRYRQLDALRGVAALTVVFHHLFMAFPGSEAHVSVFDLSSWAFWETWMKYTPLRAFVNGRPAVVLFFVLSGFVLAASFEKRALPYQDYLIRRFCRIYLPFAIAIAFAVSLFMLSPRGPIAGLTEWFNASSWTAAPSVDVVAGHLAMTGREAHIQLNNVTWSLIHELRISALFPLIVLLAVWNWRVTLAALALLWLASEAAGGFAEEGSILASILDTGGYILFFGVGAICFYNRQRLAAVAAKLPVSAICVAALVAMAIPAGAPASELLYGLASIALIGAAIGHQRIQPVFTSSPLLWLGTISYSLYLFHLPIILFALRHWYGAIDNRLLVAGIMATSLMTAQIAYWLVEKPSDQLGRTLSRRHRLA